MSIAQMNLAWRLQGLSPTQKLVLLSLADNANDAGECYPAIAQIVARTGLSERAVRGAIRALEAIGRVKTAARRGTSTTYFLSLDRPNAVEPPRQEMPPRGAANAAPAGDAGGQQMPPAPAADAPPPRHVLPPTPAAAAPKPSINHQGNHQLTVNTRAKRPSLIGDLPTWLPADAWERFDRFRAKKSGKGWTDDAKTLNLRTLAKLHEQGQDPVAVIDQSIEKGWTGLFPVREPQRVVHAHSNREDRANASLRGFLSMTGGDPADGRTIDMEAP